MSGPGSDAVREKVYVVLSGAMTVIVGGKETVLGAMDSRTIARPAKCASSSTAPTAFARCSPSSPIRRE